MVSPKKNKQHQRGSDLVNAEVAMKRAAIKAREFARISGTAVVFMKNGIIVEEYPRHIDLGHKILELFKCLKITEKDSSNA